MSFTKSEKRVIYFLLRGLRNKAIGHELCISDKTVKYHLTNIYKKAKVKNRHELIALEGEVVTPPVRQIDEPFQTGELPVGLASGKW